MRPEHPCGERALGAFRSLVAIQRDEFAAVRRTVIILKATAAQHITFQLTLLGRTDEAIE